MFAAVAHVLLPIVLLALAFVAIRQLGMLFFSGAGRADVAAAFIVIAFGLGLLVGGRKAPQAADGVAAPAQAPLAAAIAPQSRDVSKECVGDRPPLGGGVGNIDAISMPPAAAPIPWEQQLERTSAYAVVGWGVARSKSEPAVAACLVIDGRTVTGVVSHYGTPRPDVATMLKADALRDSGFQIDVPANFLRAGTHSLQIAVKSPDGSLLTITGSHSLVVR